MHNHMFRLTCILCGILPVICAVAPRSSVAILVLLTLIWCVSDCRGILKLWARPPMIFLIFSGIILWSALSSFWALDPSAASGRTIKVAIISVLGLMALSQIPQLSLDQHNILFHWVFAGFGIAGFYVLAAGAPAFSDARTAIGFGPEHALAPNFFQSIVCLTLFAWSLAPRILGSWPKPASVVSLLALAGFVHMFGTSATLLGLVCGGISALAAYRWLRRTHLVLRAACVALVMAAPVLVLSIPAPAEIREASSNIPVAHFHRLFIWKFTAERIKDKPIQGWGMDSSRDIQSLFRPAKPKPYLDGDNLEAKWLKYYSWAVGPLHPHNAMLQVWLELGLIGAIGLAAILWSVFARPRANAHTLADSVRVGLIVNGLIVASLSYGVWQSWWMATLWLAAIIFLTLNGPPRLRDER